LRALRDKIANRFLDLLGRKRAVRAKPLSPRAAILIEQRIAFLFGQFLQAHHVGRQSLREADELTAEYWREDREDHDDEDAKPPG
jgi:hypothetical protein